MAAVGTPAATVFKHMTPQDRTMFCRIFNQVYFMKYGKSTYDVSHYRRTMDKTLLKLRESQSWKNLNN